jgi:hypothetical protein
MGGLASMSLRLPYETKAGSFDEAASFLQLIEYLRLAAEAAYAIGHSRKANDDKLTGQGFLAVGQMLEMTAKNVTSLATQGHRIQ